MAPALAVFLVKVLYNKGQTDNLSQTFGRFDFPVLANIPVIGDIFFKSTSLLGYIAIAFSFLAWFILFKTRFGLRLRSVGEHPQAADTLGINVYKMRYLGVIISGFLGGIGGAIYAQSISVNFSVTTIVGPGFIALAAMILGNGIQSAPCFLVSSSGCHKVWPLSVLNCHSYKECQRFTFKSHLMF